MLSYSSQFRDDIYPVIHGKKVQASCAARAIRAQAMKHQKAMAGGSNNMAGLPRKG
jgi:hypothetical protein